MTSALISSVGRTVSTGAISYVFCRAFNQQNAFEKAVLVTVLIGLEHLAAEAIKHQRNDEYRAKPLTNVLIGSACLLAIPCALYAGRVFNFKAADYLQIVGLASIGYTISTSLINLYQMLRPE